MRKNIHLRLTWLMVFSLILSAHGLLVQTLRSNTHCGSLKTED